MVDKNITIINPERTDIIWNQVWESETEAEVVKLFSHELFVEGYRVFSKYFKEHSKKILEAGGGSGRYGIKTALDYPQSEVTIIDIAPASLDVGKLAAEKMGAKNIHFLQNDILNLTFENNSFDLILSDAVIQVLPNYQLAVRELARVLKPGGVAIIAVCNKYNFHTLYKAYLKFRNKPYEYGFEKSFSIQELKKVTNREGLSVIATDGFAAHYGLRRLRNKIWRGLGRIVQFLEWSTGPITNRFISRKFGFETVIVVKKN